MSSSMKSKPTQRCRHCALIKLCAGRQKCIENDQRAFEQVSSNPEVYLYKCCFGLYEAVAPLNVLGNVVGYLMMGQSIDGSPGSREQLKRQTAYLR